MSDSDRKIGPLELSDDLRILQAPSADYAGVNLRYPMSRVERGIVAYARARQRAAKTLSPLQMSALLEAVVRERCSGEEFWQDLAARLQQEIEKR